MRKQLFFGTASGTAVLPWQYRAQVPNFNFPTALLAVSKVPCSLLHSVSIRGVWVEVRVRVRMRGRVRVRLSTPK